MDVSFNVEYEAKVGRNDEASDALGLLRLRQRQSCIPRWPRWPNPAAGMMSDVYSTPKSRFGAPCVDDGRLGTPPAKASSPLLR